MWRLSSVLWVETGNDKVRFFFKDHPPWRTSRGRVGVALAEYSGRAALRNLSGTRDRFRGRRFFRGLAGGGFGTIQAHYVYCALYLYDYTVIYNEIIIQLTITLTGGRAQAATQAMGSGCKYRWSFARLPAAHLLLRGPVRSRPRAGTGLRPGGWGPL